MSRIPDPDIAKRNEEIVEVFQSNKQTNINKLAAQYGLSTSLVRKVLKEANVDIGGRVKQGPVPVVLDEPISRRHYRIGQLIADRRVFVMQIPATELAKRARVSCMRLVRAEFGCYSWTIEELDRVAEAIGLPFMELIDPKEASPYEQQPGREAQKVLDLHQQVPPRAVAPGNIAALRLGRSSAEAAAATGPSFG